MAEGTGVQKDMPAVLTNAVVTYRLFSMPSKEIHSYLMWLCEGKVLHTSAVSYLFGTISPGHASGIYMVWRALVVLYGIIPHSCTSPHIFTDLSSSVYSPWASLLPPVPCQHVSNGAGTLGFLAACRTHSWGDFRARKGNLA